MSRWEPVNVAASIRQRLLDIAVREEKEFQLMLVHYGIERLLFRLGQSEYSDTFILKGAMLFRVWGELSHRVTRDIDLLATHSSSAAELAVMFRAVAGSHVEPPDGLEFDLDSVQAAEIREQMEYGGIRVRLMAHLDGARIPLQIDVGFGDVIHPEPIAASYPTLIDSPAPQLKMYPKETMVAEKFEAVARLGAGNTRMKDFYDLWLLSQMYSFQGDVLETAVRSTFNRRRTPIPEEPPLALTEEFLSSDRSQNLWRAFLRRASVQEREQLSLSAVGEAVSNFVMPATHQRFSVVWSPGGPWEQARE